MGLDVRLASIEDVDMVVGLLSDAARWMGEVGMDQWPDPFPRAIVVASIEGRQTYLARTGDQVVGSIALYDEDPDFWGVRPPDALYVHRLVVSIESRGGGLGAQLLDWAHDQAGVRDRGWLRLDTGANNTALRAYYERLGFRHVEDITVTLPGAGRDEGPWHGSLYERAVAATR